MNKKKWYCLLIISILIILYSVLPISWMVRTSLLDKAELLKSPADFFTTNLTLDNYLQMLGIGDVNVLTSRNFYSAMRNSIVSSLMTTILVSVVAIISGYVFARVRTRFANVLFGVLLITMVLPAYSVMLPLYRIMLNLGLMDTVVGIVLIYISAFMPLSIWIMKSFFESIPIEIEEAAWIDGASRAKSLLTILPLALPGIVAVSIICFLNAWSQYAIPLVFASSKAQPLTVFLTTLSGKSSINFGLISAGGLLTIIPPILIVILLNKYLVSGLTKGAVK